MSATIGVLALQGDVIEHVAALGRAGADVVEVRTPDDLAGVDALVIPGGESTTVIRLLDRFGLTEPLRTRVQAGMPLWGTCMGLIVAATTHFEDPQAVVEASKSLGGAKPMYGIDLRQLDETQLLSVRGN